MSGSSPQSTDGDDAFEAQVGVKLRHTRLMKGLTLKQLAEQVGCSESLLSKIENGRANPSLNILKRLVKALGVTVGNLFAFPDDPDNVVTRAGQRPLIETDQLKHGHGIVIERLIPYSEEYLLQGNIHHIAPGDGSDGAYEHEGEEFGYVLEGQFEVTVGGRAYELNVGDTFCFRSERPHSYRNIGKTTARILWVNTPPSF